MSLIEINNLSHGFGDKEIYKNCSLTLNPGEHLGITGANGAGKSTLLKIITGQLLADNIELKILPGTTIGHMDQYLETNFNCTIYEYLKSAFSFLYEKENELNELYESMASDNGNIEKTMKKTVQIQEYLNINDFYYIENKIDKIVTGMGIDAIGTENILSELSGGQRAKVVLAKLLLESPDVLIMDEPTNFLDDNHILWLSQYLKNYKNSFIVVSHDEEFLRSIVNCVCHIEFKSLKKYMGDFDAYLKQKEFSRENHIRQYHAQQKKISETEEFIRKNKAGIKSKMARGRETILNRMERIEPPKYTSLKPDIVFKYSHINSQIVLETKKLEIGYDFPILSNITLRVQNKEKIAIKGFNGIGKSTLLKTIMGSLAPLDGKVWVSPFAKPGYFEQNLIWQNPEQTPIETMWDSYPHMTKLEIRKHLAKNGIRAVDIDQKISSLSGGEQAKLKFALLTVNPYNLLILDEPTNHLDISAKESLEEALINFEGTVILVSHDSEFYTKWADRIIEIGKMQ